MVVASKQEKRDLGLGVMQYPWALGGCSGAALLTLYFQFTVPPPVPLCTTCVLAATQTSSERESTVQEKRCGGGKGTLATLSSRFVKTSLHLPKARHHTHEAAPFQDLWQRQPLQCFQRII